MAAINVGDWLHGLSGPMGDLTDGSAQWWSQVLSSLDAYYGEYINASAVKKLQMKPEDYAGPMLRESKWLRVDKRAASMLLQAIPEAIRTEVLANRLQTTLAILARIMTIYRPGSAVERQQVLKALESPGNATNPMELVECLRKWARWLKRAQDLGLQVPDPSILLKGLDQSAKAQLERHSEVMFRTNMLRYSLELDSTPVLGAVVKYHSHLLGELEQIAYRGRIKTTPSSTAALRAMGTGASEAAHAGSPKGVTSPSSPTSAAQRPCKFFVSEAGCQRANCKFTHDWAAIPREERQERCKGCGAKGHMRRNCPVKAGGGEQPRREDGKGAPPRLRPMGKGADAKRDDGTVPTTSTTTAGASTSTGANSTTAAASAPSSLGASTDSTSSSSATAVGPESGGGPRDVDEFLRNATQILKLMTEQQSAARPSPSMKMLKKAIMEYESKMALVDSGATHPLRRASNAEWDSAPEVEVVVAGEDVKKMRQNRAGTLLLDPATERSQTILPVGSLVGVLGYEMIWSKRRCYLRSPEGKELPMKINTGCPEVAETTALELIARIEEEKLLELERNAEYTRTAMMRAQELQRDPVWEKSMKAYVTEGKFEDGFRALSSSPWIYDHLNVELARVVSDLPKSDGEAWNLMQQLGFNRRMRKRMMNKDWIVKLCSGRRSPTDKLFKVVESNGTMVLDIDRQRLSQLDLLKAGPGVMMMLLWGAATGRIAGVIAGLPKHSAEEHVLRAVSLYEVAKAGRAAMCEAMDVPLDGVAFALWASAEAEEDECSLTWQFKWFRRWMAEGHMDLLHFEQGGLGHPLRRPTSMATNLDVVELRGVRDQRLHDEDSKGAWSAWAPMMARVLARGLKRWKMRPAWYPRLVKALKAVDRRAWERHLMNDHLPYRPDCLQCIHNATGRPHRRCLHRDCYVMSADTLGPVRVPGPKGERYAVVFTYQFPKQHLVPEDHPLPDEELDGWNLDAKPKGESELPTEGDVQPWEEDGDDELPKGELDELQQQHQQPPEEESEEIDVMPMVEKLTAKDTESAEDWWEFREAAGVLIRHHVAPRTKLFRPTSWNACPLHPATLDYTRVTEVKYVGGGVETETSDWHGVQSGARALDREWTGRTTFRVSAAEIPEEEEEMQKDEAAWEKLIGDLTKPVEMDTIYMVYPVRSRRGGDIMLAVQEAVLRLKLLGMPVARLHSDRGSEFASKGLRKWLLDRDIYHTRSEALVPQTNGAAERGVRWFKTMAKVLMAEAKVGPKFWTVAMQHAANRRMYERLGLEKPRLLKFGSKVMIRRKVFGNNKKYDLTDRWEEGTYLGLSDTIKGGAVVLRPSGVITETLNLKLDIVDPHLLLAEPEEDNGAGVGDIGVQEVPVVDLPDPARRLKAKTTPPALRVLSLSEHHELQRKRGPSGWTMRSVVKQQEERAKHFYDMGKFDLETCAEVLRGVHLERARRQGRGEASSLVLGAYVHGGLRGATLSSRKRPWLTKYLNMVLRQRTVETTDREPSWATLGVFRAADIPPHRDLRNQPGSENFVMEVGSKSVGGLWLSGGEAQDSGKGFDKPHQRELPDGSVVEGVVMDITKKVAVFDPKKTHSYINPEDGDRWIVAGFTPLGVEQLPPEPVSFLNKCGFPLDRTGLEIHTVERDEVVMEDGSYSEMDDDESEEEELENRARVLRCVLQEERRELEEPEVANGFQDKVENALWECERELHWFAVRDMKKIMKVSPGQAQDVEVERLLGDLGGSLEVVHNVSLPEVKKYLDRWKPAILKEVQALIESGTVRRLSPEQTRELKKDGLVVLPGKAVFTAKPPVDASLGGDKYRRKCRIVVCGNYLPDRNLNVYASGTSSDSLRVAIAYAVKMAWLIGSTDVANAFTLAPMPGDRLYAVSPPTVVVMAQGAAPGETWLIERVLYGLREAPRLWGCFRNERLAGARIETEQGTLVLRSMTTDENMWKICFENDETMTPQGLLLVYVDDILFLSTKEIVLKVYQWLIQDWKCSALEWMHEGFIRFLGIELRVCEGGVHLSQAGYVRDLLRQHGVPEQPEAGLTIPCQREWLQDDSEEEPEAAPEESVEGIANAAVKTLKIASGKGVLVFIMVCLLLIKGVQGAKDDLQLDGSVEFYAIVILCGLACVVVWEMIKKVMSGVSAAWKAWTRKQRKVERLRERAEAAGVRAACIVKLRKRAYEDYYDSVGSAPGHYARGIVIKSTRLVAFATFRKTGEMVGMGSRIQVLERVTQLVNLPETAPTVEVNLAPPRAWKNLTAGAAGAAFAGSLTAALQLEPAGIQAALLSSIKSPDGEVVPKAKTSVILHHDEKSHRQRRQRDKGHVLQNAEKCFLVTPDFTETTRDTKSQLFLHVWWLRLRAFDAFQVQMAARDGIRGNQNCQERPEIVEALLSTALARLAECSALVEMKIPPGEDAKVVVVGDLHGQLADALHIFHSCGPPDKERRYLINGDISDRGAQAVEIWILVLAFMARYPEQVHVLRGNHENEHLNERSRLFGGGFAEECLAKYGPRIYERFQQLFLLLPLFAVLESQVFVVHGGLFRIPEVTLARLQTLPYRRHYPLGLSEEERASGKDWTEDEKILFDAQWADPTDALGITRSSRGSMVMNFGPDVTRKFLQDSDRCNTQTLTEDNELSLCIRSHQVPRTLDGFELQHDGANSILIGAFGPENTVVVPIPAPCAEYAAAFSLPLDKAGAVETSDEGFCRSHGPARLIVADFVQFLDQSGRHILRSIVTHAAWILSLPQAEKNAGLAAAAALPQDVRYIRGLTNPNVDFPAGVSAKLKVASGYLKLTNVNSFVLKLLGSLEFSDQTKAHAANCGFAEHPVDSQPGTPLDPANIAGRCSILGRFRPELLRDQLHPSALYILLGCYADRIGFTTAIATMSAVCYEVVNDGIRHLYSGLREAYEATLTQGGTAVTEAALKDVSVQGCFDHIVSSDEDFQLGIVLTMDPCGLIAKEGGHQMTDPDAGAPVTLRAASVTGPSSTAGATLLGMNIRWQGLDLGYIDSDALNATSPMQSLGYLQFESQIASGVMAKVRDYHRRDAIDLANWVNAKDLMQPALKF
ncbi:Ppp5c [Symbiodinium sp. CCMP2592]|nr:Ppp5c [Symbiodinium sp. CCMP2592]